MSNKKVVAVKMGFRGLLYLLLAATTIMAWANLIARTLPDWYNIIDATWPFWAGAIAIPFLALGAILPVLGFYWFLVWPGFEKIRVGS